MRIGIDIGGSHIGVGLVDELGIIIEKKEKDLINIYNVDIKKIIEDTIVMYINEILNNQNLKITNIKSIGIGSPGTVYKGKIVIAENLGITDFSLVNILNTHFDVPIFLKNDAKCGGICEKKYGSLKEYENCIFLTIGTGIGGAVFWDSKLLVPKKYPGFEIGHTIIDRNGQLCKCGKYGCFESYCSIVALKKNIIDFFELNQKMTGKELFKYIQENLTNVDMQKILEKYIENTAIGLSNIINIFEPEAISIGGSFVYYEDIFLEKIKIELKKNNLLFNNSIPKIFLATMKNDAGIIGASRIEE